MEGTETLILLEEVLIGKSLDPTKIQTKLRSLHLLLSSSPISVLRASGVIASRLKSSKKITEENYEIFSSYLKEIQSGKKPTKLELVHRGFTQDFAQKTFSFIFGFVRLEKQAWKSINWAFKEISTYVTDKKIEYRHKIVSADEIFTILSLAFGRLIKETFVCLEEHKQVKGKFLSRRIKKKVVIKMIKFVKTSMETIAYWKWKIKIMEHKESIKVFKLGMQSANIAIETCMVDNGLSSWKKFIANFKHFKVSLLKRLLSNAEIRYFFLKAKIIKSFLTHSKARLSSFPLTKKPSIRSLKLSSKLPAKLLSLQKILRMATIRFKCLLKTLFTKYHFNTLLEETISQVDISKVIRRKRKIIVPSGRSSRASSRKHSRNSSLNRSFKASNASALKPIVLSGELRFFYTRYIFFNKWKNFYKDESFSQEDHHHVIKRKRTLSPRQNTNAKVEELERTLDCITSRSISFSGITKTRRNSMLRSCKPQAEDLKMKSLVQFLAKTSAIRKQMMSVVISQWNCAGIRYEGVRNSKLGVVFTLIKMINSNKKIRGDYFLRWKTQNNGKVINFEVKESLNIVAMMAFKFEFCKKQVFYKLRQGMERMSRVNNIKLAFRSIFKIYRLIYYQYFVTWRDNIKKSDANVMLKMLQTLNKAVVFNGQKILGIKNKSKIPIASALNMKEKLDNIFKSRKKYAFKKFPFLKKTSNQRKLKKVVKNLLSKLALRSKKMFRPLRIMKNADSIRKIALQKIKIKILAIYERFKCKWTMWRLLMEKSNYTEIFEALKKHRIIFSVQRPLKRLLSKFFFELILKSDTLMPSDFMQIISKVLNFRLSTYFNSFRAKDLSKFFRLQGTLVKLIQKPFRTTFNSLTKPITFNYLGNSYKIALNSAFQQLKFRVNSYKLLSKFKSVLRFSRFLRNIKKRLMNNRIAKWKAFENLHKKFLARKYLFHIIFYTSISEETSIWRWKYRLFNNCPVSPQQSVMCKRVLGVGYKYQNRLKQYALFKLVIFTRLFTAGLFPSPNTSFLRAQDLDDSEMTYDKSLNQVSESSNFSTRPTKDDFNSISRNGAIEVLSLSFKTCLARKLTWAFSCLDFCTSKLRAEDTEKSDLIHQLNTLIYDKSCLLEDNNSLRTHNEALIQSLEQTNDYCNSLSLMINEIQISKMVAHLKKMVEIPLFHVFLTLKLNQESYSSF